MDNTITLKDKLTAVDTNIVDLWDALDENQQKELTKEFFILNRYVSSVKNGSREQQEHYVLTANEYFNKNWNNIQKHPKLLWRLLCLCNYNGSKVFFHEWIALKKKQEISSKRGQFLEKLYPNKKADEINLLTSIMTDQEFRQLAKDNGLDDTEIKRLLK